MAVQGILIYPHPKLTEPCTPVEDFESDEFKALVMDLRDTAEQRGAQGLAAPQLGELKRVFVTKDSDSGEYKVFVNPTLELEGDRVRNREGCLSFPGLLELVERPEEVTITAKDEEGKEFTVYADDVESVAIQHEYDHLDGILFTQRVSPLVRRFMLKRLKKIKKKYIIR